MQSKSEPTGSVACAWHPSCDPRRRGARSTKAVLMFRLTASNRARGFFCAQIRIGKICTMSAGMLSPEERAAYHEAGHAVVA